MHTYTFFTASTACTILALWSMALFKPLPTSSKPLVVVTTNIIADAVKCICKDEIDICCLMGPGVDPHLYRATEGNMRSIYCADIIFFNGLDLEGKMARVMQQGKQHLPLYCVTEYIPVTQLIQSETPGVFDPHVWHDPLLHNQCLSLIADTLSKHYPSKKAIFIKNYEKTAKQLHALHNWITQQSSSITKSQKIIVTAHDAFAYFARAYGFRVVSLQGISTQTQIGVKDISSVAKTLIEHQISTLFTESSTLNKPLRAIVLECQHFDWPVTIVDTLYSDALATPGMSGDTYFSMMHHNVNAIVTGLQKKGIK